MKQINLRHVIIDPKDNKLVRKRNLSAWPELLFLIIVLCVIAAVAVTLG